MTHMITEPGHRPNKLLSFESSKWWQRALCEFEDGGAARAIDLTAFVEPHARSIESMLTAMPAADLEAIRDYMAARPTAIAKVKRRYRRGSGNVKPRDYFVTDKYVNEIGQQVTYFVVGPLRSRFQMKKALRRAKLTRPNARGFVGRAT